MRTRVLFISGRETGYIRNRVLLQALRTRFDVVVLSPNRGHTLSRSIVGLARALAHPRDYDVCFAGFYGQHLALSLSVIQRKPIILDAFVSTYDTLCEDRRRFRPRSPGGRLAYWLDRQSCRVAAHVITDTQAHASYFAETFGILIGKLQPIYVGCDDTLFFPRPQAAADSRHFEVFYYGSFLPLHGTHIIVQAAALLRDRPEFRFSIGGDGAQLAAVKQMIAGLALNNIDFVGWIPLEQLPDHISRASVCLGGHFSTIPKAARVISTKTFQFVAMQKPTIVGDNPATRELFDPGEHVYAVPMGDPEALAHAIQTLAADGELRSRIASGGYEVFQRRLTTSVVADQLASLVEGVLPDATARP